MNDTDYVDALDDPALQEWLRRLEALGDTPAPAPSDELARLFAGTEGGRTVRVASTTRGRAAIAGLATAALLGGSVGAAAADALPGPAQHIVASLIRTFTPFAVPDPDDPSLREQSPEVHTEGPDVNPENLTTPPAPFDRGAAEPDDDNVGESDRSSDDRQDESAERPDIESEDEDSGPLEDAPPSGTSSDTDDEAESDDVGAPLISEPSENELGVPWPEDSGDNADTDAGID